MKAKPSTTNQHTLSAFEEDPKEENKENLVVWSTGTAKDKTDVPGFKSTDSRSLKIYRMFKNDSSVSLDNKKRVKALINHLKQPGKNKKTPLKDNRDVHPLRKDHMMIQTKNGKIKLKQIFDEVTIFPEEIPEVKNKAKEHLKK